MDWKHSAVKFGISLNKNKEEIVEIISSNLPQCDF